MEKAKNSAGAASAQASQHQTAMHPLYPAHKGFAPEGEVAVGGVVLAAQPIEYNVGRTTLSIEVRNMGDRPIQVGSHFHFFEVNRYLEFDRAAAFGMHLNIPATTAIRFEPGDAREVELVRFGGKRRVIGFNGLVEGYAGVEDKPDYYPVFRHAMRHMRHQGYMSTCECAGQQKEKCSKREKQ